MEYILSKLNNGKIDEVVKLSKKWEDESITYGLTAGDAGDFEKLSVWTCTYNEQIIAYLSGSKQFSENMCVFPPSTDYFEIEELYVSPEWRNKGIGTDLFRFVEQEIAKQNIKYIMLSSASINYQKIIEFYTQMGMNVWTMMFFKQI